MFGLQYSISIVQYKGFRRIGGGDQADIFNLIQDSQNTVVRLKVLLDEEQWRVARGSKRGKRVGMIPTRTTCQGYGYGNRHTDAPHAQ